MEEKRKGLLHLVDDDFDMMMGLVVVKNSLVGENEKAL